MPETMFRPRAFAVDDVAILHAFIRARGFAIVAAVIEGGINFGYAPVVLSDDAVPGTVRFHLARANPLARLDGANVRLSFLGPDAYVSPDWYGTEGFVPTWNYIAVEATGVALALDREELRRLLADLSRLHEERLLPKPPWKLEKISAEKESALMDAIVGFSVRLETLEGKFKLSQDKRPEQFRGVIAALEASARPEDRAVAAAMRRLDA